MSKILCNRRCYSENEQQKTTTTTKMHNINKKKSKKCNRTNKFPQKKGPTENYKYI